MHPEASVPVSETYMGAPRQEAPKLIPTAHGRLRKPPTGTPGEMANPGPIGGLGPLVNDHSSPNVHIFREKPEYRLMVYQKALGKSNIEIGQDLGYTPALVGQILRQPAMRKLFAELTHEAGLSKVTALLEGEVVNNIQTLIDIRDSDKARAADRLNAANSLLDRFLGKPTQTVKSEVRTGTLDDHKEMDRLTKELEDVRAEQATYGIPQVGSN